MEIRAAREAFTVSLISERGYSANTVRGYTVDLTDLEGFASRRGIEDVSGLSLDLLRDWLWVASEKQLARATLARRTAAVRGFTAWLVRSEHLELDPALRLRSPKGHRTLPRVLTATGMEGVLERLQAQAESREPAAIRDLAVIELLYASALRVSELCGLDVDDLDRERLTLLATGKGDRPLPLRGTTRARHRGDAGAVPRGPWRAPGNARRLPPGRRAPRGGARFRSGGPAHAAAHGGDASARRGSGPARGAGAARAREPRDDPDLHARVDGTSEARVRPGASASLTEDARSTSGSRTARRTPSRRTSGER
jgi:integrase